MCQHDLHFYEDSYPAEHISTFFAEGLAVGDSCLALLTQTRRRAVEQCLLAQGVHVERVAFVGVDSDELLSRVTVNGALDIALADELLTPLMRPPASGGTGRVRAVGDVAPTLCTLGRLDDAVAFEGLVHRVTLQHDAAVICAYPLRINGMAGGVNAMIRLSAQHAAIRFPQHTWIHHLIPVAGAA
jgi:hypothetical protein